MKGAPVAIPSGCSHQRWPAFQTASACFFNSDMKAVGQSVEFARFDLTGTVLLQNDGIPRPAENNISGTITTIDINEA